jgi:hypothetical protein
MTLELKFVGVLIACVGNALIGVSFPVMKLAHNRNSESLPYFKLRLWWLANLLMVLGEIGNLAAYTLARPALISPLGAVSVVVNGPASWIILQEPIGWRGCLGALFCILGGVGIVHVTAGQADDGAFVTVEQFQTMASTPPFMLYITFILALSVALMLSKKRHFLVYLLICSFLGAVTVLSIKGFTSFIVISLGAGPNQFTYPLPWVLIPVLLVSMAIQVCVQLSAMLRAGVSHTQRRCAQSPHALQVHYLNKAMAEYGTGQVRFLVTLAAARLLKGCRLYRPTTAFLRVRL